MAGAKGHHYFIDVLRATACYLVVFHHCLGYGESASFAVFYATYLKAFFPTVSLYLMVSGFVHAQVIERRKQSYLQHVGDKFNRIMVPYFCVSLVTLLIRLAVERTAVIPLDQVHYMPFGWASAVMRLLFSGVEGHYYFLEMLFVYLLIFPFVVKRLTRPLTAGLFFIAVVGLDLVLEPLYQPYQSPVWSPLAVGASMLAGFKFFVLGFLLNRCHPHLESLLSRRGVVVGALSLAGFGLLYRWLPAGNEYWTLLELFAYFSLAFSLFNRAIPWVVDVSALSFGIYLLHQPYFVKISRILTSGLTAYPNAQLLLTSLLTAVLTTLAVKWIAGYAFSSRWVLGKAA